MPHIHVGECEDGGEREPSQSVWKSERLYPIFFRREGAGLAAHDRMHKCVGSWGQADAIFPNFNT